MAVLLVLDLVKGKRKGEWADTPSRGRPVSRACLKVTKQGA